MIPPSADYDERLREEGIIMNEPKKEVTIIQLFKGQENNLLRIIFEIQQGVKSRKDITEDSITPIIKRISKNAEQEMDPAYIYCMIEYALSIKAAPEKLE